MCKSVLSSFDGDFHAPDFNQNKPRTRMVQTQNDHEEIVQIREMMQVIRLQEPAK